MAKLAMLEHARDMMQAREAQQVLTVQPPIRPIHSTGRRFSALRSPASSS